MLLHVQGRFNEANEQLRTALGVVEDLPQQDGSEQSVISGCYFHLGLIAMYQGDKARAREMIGKSLAIDEALHDDGGVRLCQRALAQCDR
jgi:hypothetical protein